MSSAPPDLRLDWCSHEAARYAVEHWHYTRSLPTPPLVKIGVWERGRFIGCVLFSRGAARHIGAPFGLDQTEIAELTRVALARHEAPVSRIVSIAIRLLRRQSPGLRLLVSYADPAQGHVGTIYQAGNWLYLGQGQTTPMYRGPDGKVWHSRMVSPTGRKKVYGSYRAVWKPNQCDRIDMPGKLKYALPLDAGMRQQLQPLVRPYLSGPAGVASDTAADQDAVGGANPTAGLHSTSKAVRDERVTASS